MDTIRKVAIFISLFSSISAHPSVPSILVQEGQSAEISCLAKGSHDAYFWWKGESLHNSTEIASFVGGIPSSPTGSYKATENGTLIITKVSLSDEGKYICRVSSAFSDCNGVIMVYVQASIPDFALGIDLCDGDTSCVIQIAPPKSTKLICEATDASPSMELKWFNGSTEITEGIEFEDPVMTGTSRVISATINVAPECAGSLICQAVDPKTKDDGGRFAHVQLELPGSAIKEASTGWMVTAIIFLVSCIVLIAVLACIIVKLRKTKGKDESKPEEGEQLMLEVNNKAMQDKIEELTREVNNKDSDIKAQQQKLEELMKNVQDATTNIKVKDVSAKVETRFKDKELQMKDQELSKLQAEAQINNKERSRHIDEITKLKVEAENNEKERRQHIDEIKTLKAEAENNNKERRQYIDEIATLKAEAQNNNKERRQYIDEIATLKAEAQNNNKERRQYIDEIATLKTEAQNNEKEKGQHIDEIKKLKDLKIKWKDIPSKHEAAVKNLEESERKLEKITLDEESMKMDFRNLENSERSFRAKKMDYLEKNYVTVIPKESSPVTIKMDGNVRTIKLQSTGPQYKFSRILPIGAHVREIYEQVKCYIQNAIDGGESFVFAFGQTRSTGTPQLSTMYGERDWQNAILPLTFKEILEKAKQLESRKYSVKIRSRFVHVIENAKGEQEFMFKKGTPADCFKDPKKIPSTESNDSKSFELPFMEHRESVMNDQIKHHSFVQFVINTEEESKTVTTGTITLVTLLGAKVAQACFEKEVPKSPLEQFLANSVHKANSRCLLLAHLNEDKEDIKEVLKVAKTISEGKKK